MRITLLAGSALLLGLAACTGENAKDATAAAVGKTVELGKGTITGIAEGVEEGRKSGESVDGAVIVSSLAELRAQGDVAVLAARASAGNSALTEVDLAFENKGEKPMRITNLEVLGIDKEGFAKNVTGIPMEVTVPARAKSKTTLTLEGEAGKLKNVRVYGEDLPMPK